MPHSLNDRGFMLLHQCYAYKITWSHESCKNHDDIITGKSFHITNPTYKESSIDWWTNHKWIWSKGSDALLFTLLLLVTFVACINTYHVCFWCKSPNFMMTLWHGKYGNGYQVNGPLWGQSTGEQYILFTDLQQCTILIFSMWLAGSNCSKNSPVANQLRCHDTHVMLLI